MDKIYSRPRIIILGKRNKNLKNVFIIILFLGIFFAISIAIRSGYSIFFEKAKSRAKVVASKIINDSISEVIDKYTYEDFISIENNKNGEINLIKTRVGRINKFKSDINNSVNSRFANSEETTISMRLGSFFGNSFFSTIGPNIKIKVEYSGNVQSELFSEFEAVGINQTKHKLYIKSICNVYILSPFNTTGNQVEETALVAESIIMGEIPNTYYYIDGVNSSDAMNMMGD